MKLDQARFEEELVRRLGPVEGVVLLYRHFDLLRRWNQRLNLTAIRDELEMIERHYCESIFLARHVPRETRTVLDIGSGAGFPGLPLAITRPELTLTLVESHQRKAVFLREASRNLGNVRIESMRAEQLECTADLMISRAVDPNQVLALLPRLSQKALILAGDIEIPNAERSLLPWGARRFLVSVERT